MFLCYLASSLRLALKRTPTNGPRILSSLFICVALVHQYVFAHQVSPLPTKGHKSSPLLPPVVPEAETYPFPVILHLWRMFHPPRFFLVVFDYIECFGLAIRNCLLYLFIYLFNFNNLWAVQLSYICVIYLLFYLSFIYLFFINFLFSSRL